MISVTRQIAVCNQKGGVGKTSITINLAHALSETGKKILVMDLDSQGNVGISLKLKHSLTVSDLFRNGNNLPLADYVASYKGLFDVIVSDNGLGATEAEITGKMGRELILSHILEDLLPIGTYDFIFFDTSPSISYINQNAFMASSEVIIPVTLDYFSLFGLQQTIENIVLLRKMFKHKISITGIIPSITNIQTNISKQILVQIEKDYKDKMLPSVRASVKARECSALAKTIIEYDPEGKLAADYRAIAKEILSNRHQAPKHE